MKNTGEPLFYFCLISLGNSFICNTCLLRILVHRYFEKGLSKSLKSVNLTPQLMRKIMKNKKSLELVTSRSSGYKTSSEKLLY